MAKLLYRYDNGGYTVALYEDWTKIWRWEGEREFPDSMDVKITNYCDANCSYCHEESTTEWRHWDLHHFMQEIKKLPKGIEIAIGGGNPLSHPEIITFLKELKENWYVPNVTVNAKHQYMITQELEDNIYWIWISYTQPITYNNPNMVIHFIAWIHSYELINSYLKKWYKCLILWYKNHWRWKINDFINSRINKKIIELKEHLPAMKWLLAFDSLAVYQLLPQEIVSKDYWDLHFTGDDWTLSMYFDLVKGEYAKNSFALDRYDFNGSIFEAFNTIKHD